MAFAASIGVASGAWAADDHRDYYAGRAALARGDCPAAASHLEAFLRRHADIKERYPDFHLEVRLAIAQCTGAVTVRGVGEESDSIGPLPEHPPGVE